jgi:hypothetical protein
MRSRWLREFTLVSGRTRFRQYLLLETLVSVAVPDREAEQDLSPYAQKIYTHACARPVSLAELASRTKISLGVIRVLVSDLAADGKVRIHPNGQAFSRDLVTLEKVLDGLRNLDLHKAPAV